MPEVALKVNPDKTENRLLQSNNIPFGSRIYVTLWKDKLLYDTNVAISSGNIDRPVPKRTDFGGQEEIGAEEAAHWAARPNNLG